MALFLPAAAIALTCALLRGGGIRGDAPAGAKGESEVRVIGKPTAHLPKHVTAVAGQVTLFADFAAKAADSVPLYFVNRTGQALSITSDRADFHPLLEAKLEDGNWHRVQTMVFARCGLSYSTKVLPPEHFLQFAGNLSADGDERPVRIRLHHDPQVVSNVGVGRVTPEMVRTAAADVLAIEEGRFEALLAIASDNRLGGDKSSRERCLHGLVERLERIPDGRTLPLLRKMVDDPKCDLAGAAMANWYRLEPTDARKHGFAVIDDRAHPHRGDILRALKPCHDEPEYRERLMRIVESPDDPAADAALDVLIWSDGEDAAPLLRKLQNNPLAQPAIRKKASEHLAPKAG